MPTLSTCNDTWYQKWKEKITIKAIRIHNKNSLGKTWKRISATTTFVSVEEVLQHVQ